MLCAALGAAIACPLVNLFVFGDIGPIAGSFATAWQAAIGNLAAGSLFAFLQNLAMTGAMAGIGTALGAGGAAFAFAPSTMWEAVRGAMGKVRDCVVSGARKA